MSQRKVREPDLEQALSDSLARVDNVLELDNTSAFTPDADYEPATKKYVDDNLFTSPLTTKGDIFTHDTDDARLAVGTDAQVLTADSTEATGLKWADPSGGGETPIEKRLDYNFSPVYGVDVDYNDTEDDCRIDFSGAYLAGVEFESQTKTQKLKSRIHAIRTMCVPYWQRAGEVTGETNITPPIRYSGSWSDFTDGDLVFGGGTTTTTEGDYVEFDFEGVAVGALLDSRTNGSSYIVEIVAKGSAVSLPNYIKQKKSYTQDRAGVIQPNVVVYYDDLPYGEYTLRMTVTEVPSADDFYFTSGFCFTTYCNQYPAQACYVQTTATNVVNDVPVGAFLLTGTWANWHRENSQAWGAYDHRTDTLNDTVEFSFYGDRLYLELQCGTVQSNQIRVQIQKWDYSNSEWKQDGGSDDFVVEGCVSTDSYGGGDMHASIRVDEGNLTAIGFYRCVVTNETTEDLTICGYSTYISAMPEDGDPECYTTMKYPLIMGKESQIIEATNSDLFYSGATWSEGIEYVDSFRRRYNYSNSNTAFVTIDKDAGESDVICKAIYGVFTSKTNGSNNVRIKYTDESSGEAYYKFINTDLQAGEVPRRVVKLFDAGEPIFQDENGESILNTSFGDGSGYLYGDIVIDNLDTGFLYIEGFIREGYAYNNVGTLMGESETGTPANPSVCWNQFYGHNGGGLETAISNVYRIELYGNIKPSNFYPDRSPVVHSAWGFDNYAYANIGIMRTGMEFIYYKYGVACDCTALQDSPALSAWRDLPDVIYYSSTTTAWHKWMIRLSRVW